MSSFRKDKNYNRIWMDYALFSLWGSGSFPTWFSNETVWIVPQPIKTNKSVAKNSAYFSRVNLWNEARTMIENNIQINKQTNKNKNKNTKNNNYDRLIIYEITSTSIISIRPKFVKCKVGWYEISAIWLSAKNIVQSMKTQHAWTKQNTR